MRELSTLDLNSDDKSTKGNLSINIKNSLFQSVVNFRFSALSFNRALLKLLKFLRLRIILKLVHAIFFTVIIVIVVNVEK